MCVSSIVLQVQSSLADTLLHCGVATSRYAARLFRPPKDAAPPASYSASTSGSLSATADKAPGDALTQPPAGTLELVTAAPASSSLSDGTTNSSSTAGWLAGGAGDLSSPQPPAAAAASHSSSAGTQGLRSTAADDASAEAEAEAALAAADVIMEQLAAVNAADVASGYVAADGDFEFKSSQGSGRQGLSAEPLPLVMQETHTEQE